MFGSVHFLIERRNECLCGWSKSGPDDVVQQAYIEHVASTRQKLQARTSGHWPVPFPQEKKFLKRQTWIMQCSCGHTFRNTIGFPPAPSMPMPGTPISFTKVSDMELFFDEHVQIHTATRLSKPPVKKPRPVDPRIVQSIKDRFLLDE